MRRYERNAEMGRERKERRGESRREEGKGKTHFLFIPVSKNGIQILVPFAAKEMMDSIAASLRF